MRRLFRWLRGHRDHVPRLWPIALCDFDTREISYELGVFNAQLGRVCVRCR